MDMIYDLKMLHPDKESRLKSLYEEYLGRLNPAQRAAWDKFYTPIIEDFYRKKPSGERTCKLEVSTLYARLYENREVSR